MIIYDNNSFFGIILSARGTVLRKRVFLRVIGCGAYSLIPVALVNQGKTNSPGTGVGDDVGILRSNVFQSFLVIGWILGLLLSMRIDTAFARWDGAIETLDDLTNSSRQLFQYILHLPEAGQVNADGSCVSAEDRNPSNLEGLNIRRSQRTERFRRLILATVITILKGSPTYPVHDIEDLLTCQLLTVEEYRALIKTKFGPTLPQQFPPDVRASLIIAYLRQEICACWSNNLMGPVTVVHLDQLLNRLSAQIFTPPQIPFLYTNYMRVLLCFYMAVTPFAISVKYGWLTPIATMVAGLALLGADEITTVVEEPYGTRKNHMNITKRIRLLDAELATMAAMKYTELGTICQIDVAQYNTADFWDGARKAKDTQGDEQNDEGSTDDTDSQRRKQSNDLRRRGRGNRRSTASTSSNLSWRAGTLREPLTPSRPFSRDNQTSAPAPAPPAKHIPGRSVSTANVVINATYPPPDAENPASSPASSAGASLVGTAPGSPGSSTETTKASRESGTSFKYHSDV